MSNRIKKDNRKIKKDRIKSTKRYFKACFLTIFISFILLIRFKFNIDSELYH